MKQQKHYGWIIACVLLALTVCCVGLVGLGGAVHTHAQESLYTLGNATTPSERLEAENPLKDGKLTTPSVGNKCNFVSGQFLELSANGGSATFPVAVAEGGAYIAKLAYYTGSGSPKLRVAVNGGTPVVTDALAVNGWASAGEAWTYYVNVPVTLVAGQNTLVVTQEQAAGGYVNLDYIELYRKDAVYYYPVEHKLAPDLAGVWGVGERIEAEWMTYSGSINFEGLKSDATANYNEISGKFAKFPSGTASFDIDVGQAGTYAVKLGYFTGTNNAAMSFTVAANGGTEVTSDPLRLNGWGNGGNIVRYYAQVSLALNKGINTVTVRQTHTSGYYINFDFAEVYPIDAVHYYPIEHSLYPTLAGGHAVGERIEAEHGYNVNLSGRSYQEVTGSCVSGTLMWLGSSPVRYSVQTEQAGTYYLQIVNGCNGEVGATTKMEYTVTVGDREYVFTDFALASYNGAANVVQTAGYFEVELAKGINVFTLNSIAATAKTRTDFFCFFPKTDLIDEVGQFERYAYGAAKVIKSEQTYPEIDEFVTEFVSNRFSSVVLPVTTQKAGWYDLYVRAWSGGGCAFDLAINGGAITTYPTQNSGWVSGGGIQKPKDNVYRIWLDEGNNTLTFTKNASSYVDLDWFYITEEKLATLPNDGEGFRVAAGESIEVSELAVAVEDTAVARAEGGTVVTVAGGKTRVSLCYTMDNGYVLTRWYALTVYKNDFDGTMTAPDLTVAYSGSVQYYTCATVPEGWSVAVNDPQGLCAPGTKTVAVKFTHPLYRDVLTTATFTVTKADYAGDDLVASNVTGMYDGTTRYTVAASAPDGWDIHYSTNGRLVKGVTEVTVTFTHPCYNTVVKSATITVS